MRNEISDMGEFVLLMTKERVVEQGVEANTIYRKGNLHQEIKKTLSRRAYPLSYLVIRSMIKAPSNWRGWKNSHKRLNPGPGSKLKSFEEL